MPALFLGFVFLISLLRSHQSLAIAGDCPLDFSWSNFTLPASTCSNPNERGQCCRYINALVAISVSNYANATGKLGVPPAFSDDCLNSISKTFTSYGIPASAITFCGLGPKIRVNYQCEGRETVLEMMQSPNFLDVRKSCEMSLSVESSCRTCLNSGIEYLHRLIGGDDNVTLSVCRNAVFVVLANQGGESSAVDMAGCFFGVKGLGVASEPSSTSLVPAASPGQASLSPPFVQDPAQNLTAMSLKKHHKVYHLKLLLGISTAVLGIAILMLLILVILIRKKAKEFRKEDTINDTSWNALPPPQARKFQDGAPYTFQRFSYKETKKATGNFSTFIGKGGFGTVFKAQFDDGSIAAVKRMDKVSKQGEEDFCREMELLARLHHRHLVSLRGFCIEKNERFLVYEYMENGSLKDHLHSPGRKPLSWQARLQVAIDVANALEYLHFYCNPPLCHRDIKSSNILLDENFVAKVADFGLAHASRSGAISFEPVSTDIRGTPGYMDPEYVVTQELTEKSDIYSYGVLLLELLTGRRAIQDNRNIVEWSQKFIASESRLPELVDPRIGESFEMEQLQMLVGIIQWCTQREGRSRPSIKQILRVLSESLDPINDDGQCSGLGEISSRFMARRSEVIPNSGDTRCLMSSSSTSRSYCSRSVLLETGSPQSPPGTFSV
ncbi:uncharacterized protein A4U43_C04F3770 [Asparagus officinalis]|uniref:Protein kinase domain-containing protein n=1 Tax=Asparagus officinalis TaxID=4686 RepID=A0A5P1EY05_ASPOF|nr:probable receptor-like protein kinase At1g49730 [Asparagus officinalis]ONK71008.1 uncharacterized protein A4U43_C04F3770 [Asparagus officinalis]